MLRIFWHALLGSFDCHSFFFFSIFCEHFHGIYFANIFRFPWVSITTEIVIKMNLVKGIKERHSVVKYFALSIYEIYLTMQNWHGNIIVDIFQTMVNLTILKQWENIYIFYVYIKSNSYLRNVYFIIGKKLHTCTHKYASEIPL